MLAVALDDGRMVLLACRSSTHPGEAANWYSLHTVRTSADDPVISMAWHPGPVTWSPFFALATSGAVSIWCLDRCVLSVDCSGAAPHCSAVEVKGCCLSVAHEHAAATFPVNLVKACVCWRLMLQAVVRRRRGRIRALHITHTALRIFSAM